MNAGRAKSTIRVKYRRRYIVYRLSRIVWFALCSAFSYCIAMGAWYDLHSPYSWNPKNLHRYETTIFDTLFNIGILGVAAFFAIALALITLGYILLSNVVIIQYAKYRRRKRKAL